MGATTGLQEEFANEVAAVYRLRKGGS